MEQYKTLPKFHITISSAFMSSYPAQSTRVSNEWQAVTSYCRQSYLQHHLHCGKFHKTNSFIANFTLWNIIFRYSWEMTSGPSYCKYSKRFAWRKEWKLFSIGFGSDTSEATTTNLKLHLFWTPFCWTSSNKAWNFCFCFPHIGANR